MKQRYYQRAAAQNVQDNVAQGKNRNLVIIPVGGGKSHVISALTAWGLETLPQKKTIILTHRKELSAQNAQKILAASPGANLGFERARTRCPTSADIMMASVQTVGKKGIDRIRQWCNPQEIGHILIDEAHHIPGGKTYQDLLIDLQAANPNLIVTGFTATPHRADGERLDRFLPNIAYQISLPELVHQGYLARLRGRRIQTDASMEDFIGDRTKDFNEAKLQKALNTANRNKLALDIYMNFHRGEQSIAFCTGKQHAHDVAELFRSAGIQAAAITESTPEKERDDLIAAYKAHKIQVLTNAFTLTEGFDAPYIKSALLLRPTKSPVLFEQCVGRTTRLVLEPNPEDPQGEWIPNRDIKNESTIYEFFDRGALEAGAQSLGSMLDLNPNFDFEGNDIFEIQSQIKTHSESEPLLAACLAQTHSKDELEKILVNHNILSELQALHYSNDSQLPWIEGPRGEHWMQLAHNELVQLHPTALGTYELECDPICLTPRRQSQASFKERNPNRTLNPLPKANHPTKEDHFQISPTNRITLDADSKEEALAQASAFIEKTFACDTALLRSKTQRRFQNSQEATPAQLHFIRKNKVAIHEDDLKHLTKSQAEEIIDKTTLQKNLLKKEGKIPLWKYKGTPIPLIALYNPEYLSFLLKEKREDLQKENIEKQILAALSPQKNLLPWFYKFRKSEAETTFGPQGGKWSQYAEKKPAIIRNRIRKVLDQSPLPPWPLATQRAESQPEPKRLQEILQPTETPKNPLKTKGSKTQTPEYAKYGAPELF